MKQRTLSSWSEVRHRQRPRVLIEDPHPALQVADFRFFEDAGFDVAVCSGPREADACPLEEGGECRLAELADVVVMGPGMASHRAAVAAEMHRRRPDVPIVVQIPRGDPGQCPAGCVAQYTPISVEGQIQSVWRALEGQDATSRQIFSEKWSPGGEEMTFGPPA